MTSAPSPLSHRLAPVADLPGHDDRAWSVAWNPAEPLLASCSADRTVRMWAYRRAADADAGAARVAFRPAATIATGHAKTVRALAWAPAGGALATASFDANVGVWERAPATDEYGADDDGDARAGAGEWECASLLEGHETECKGVAYAPSGALLASCSRDKSVWIWEVHPDADFECAAVLMEHTQDVKCVAWHPSEEILASASYDDTIKLYADDPADDWACVASLAGHASTVWALAWCPAPALPAAADTARDRAFLASAGADGAVRVWRRTGEHAWAPALVLEGVHERAALGLAWGAGAAPPRAGADGAAEGGEGAWLGWLASAGADGVINVWAMRETEGEAGIEATLAARVEDAHGVHDVNALAWCPRAGFMRMLASAGDDGQVRVWAVAEA